METTCLFQERGFVVSEKREALRREIDEAITRAEKGQRRKLETRSNSGSEDEGVEEEPARDPETDADQSAADEAAKTADEKEKAGEETVV